MYKHINPAISKATADKLKSHLWYPSEENVGLTLFDEEVSLVVKKKIVMRIKHQEEDNDGKPHRRCIQDLETLVLSNLDSFASPKTMRFFEILHIPMDFLDADRPWEMNATFQAAQEQLKHLQVVNDHAERGIVLIQQFNRILTKDEEQLQFLLQVVADHRRNYPDARKEVLAQTKHQ